MVLIRIFLFVGVCFKENPDLKIGDYCTLESPGGQGECKLLRDCATALDAWRANKTEPQFCSLPEREEIVCCPKIKTLPSRIPGDISRQKCKVYSEYAITKYQSPIIGDPPFLKNECGHRAIKFIVDEAPASRKEFPHMAKIGYEPSPGNIQWACEGSLISKNYILTAGHCLSSNKLGPAKLVKLGVTNLNQISRNRQKLRIAERIPYPEYRPNSDYHDIGLLKLERPAIMTSYTRPACLNLNYNIFDKKAIATGWGNTAYGGVNSDDLLKVTLDLFDHGSCNKSYQNQISRRLTSGILDDIQVCAGSKDEDKDTCQVTLEDLFKFITVTTTCSACTIL